MRGLNDDDAVAGLSMARAADRMQAETVAAQQSEMRRLEGKIARARAGIERLEQRAAGAASSAPIIVGDPVRVADEFRGIASDCRALIILIESLR